MSGIAGLKTTSGGIVALQAEDTAADKTVTIPAVDGDAVVVDAAGANSQIRSGTPFRKNAIINGAFNIWQRGTSFASIADNTYTADRWLYRKSGAMVHTVARSTDVPTVAQAGRLFNYSLHADCTTVDSSIAAGDYAIIQQKVEGFNWLSLAQRACTLSFWVKATKTGTYCVAMNNSGFDRSCIMEYSVNAADTWELKTVTFPASPATGTWDYTTGIGVQINWPLAGGSTFQTTAGSWGTGNYFATANQVNACDSTSNDFRICGVQLEPGSVATEFECRHHQDEVQLCQRYFVKTFALSVTPGDNVNDLGTLVGTNVQTAGWEPAANWRFPVEMRDTPTVTLYNPYTGTAGQWADGGGNVSANARSIQFSTTGGWLDNAGTTIGGTRHRIHATASAEL